MHPLVAKFLSPKSALDVLDRRDRGEALDPDESAFVGATERFPDYRAALLGTRGKKTVAPEVEQMLLVVAASAVTSTLEEDPRLGVAAQSAREALTAQGATRDEVDALITTAVLEEALASEDSPDVFEAEFLQETLQTLSALAEVSEERVAKLLDEVDTTEGSAARAAAGLLLETAWGDGPQPVTTEHLQDASEASAELPADRRAEAVRGLEGVIAALAANGFVGPLRRGRLERALPRR